MFLLFFWGLFKFYMGPWLTYFNQTHELPSRIVTTVIYTQSEQAWAISLLSVTWLLDWAGTCCTLDFFPTKKNISCQTATKRYTVADNGSAGSSVIDSAHSFIAFRPSSVLWSKETHEVTKEWLISIYKVPSNYTYPYSQSNHLVIDIKGFRNKGSPYSLNETKTIH